MDFQVLGPLQVGTASGPVPIPGVKERALLGLLVVEAGTVVSSDRMIYELWGDEPPQTALRTLRTHISRLRKALGGNEIVTRRPGYVLTADMASIDATRFEQLADDVRRTVDGDPAAALDIASTALALWRGRAFEDLVGFEYAEVEARRLEERRLHTVERQVEAALSLGRHDTVLAGLHKLVGEHPFHERFWRQLMFALYRSGRAGEALGAFADAERALGESLGIGPSIDLRLLERAIVMEDPALDIATGLPEHNLPSQPSSFIGREEEMEDLATALRGSRCVTLSGPGGCGKSRLAIETAARVLASFPDGVWRTELAPIRQPDEVPVAVAAALGEPGSHAIDPVRSLVEYVADRRMLLVIDNCEHLLEACATLISKLLSRCPQIHVLATSREPLRIDGETVWVVPPLALPAPDAGSQEQESAEAFRLFVDRSRAADPGFTVDDDNRADVVAVCQSLAGLPLALELAAARARSLSPRQIVERDGDLDTLSAGRRPGSNRHATMQSALDWSYELLNADEQAMLRGLAVFTGGWAVAAAEDILGDEVVERDRVVALVTHLVEKSLVEPVRDPELPEARYRLLEPIREFAATRLEATGTRAPLVDRHASWYGALAEEGDRGVRGAEQQAWWRRLEADHDNLRSAIRRSIDRGDVRTALKLVAAMGWFWFQRGHWRECARWTDEAYAAAGDDDALLRARMVHKAASVEIIRVNPEPAVTWMRRALKDTTAAGDRLSAAWCRHFIAHAHSAAMTQEIHDELLAAHEVFRELDDRWAMAWSERYIGWAAAELGEPEEAIDLQVASTATFRALGDHWSTAFGLYHLGMLHQMVFGDPAAARPYYQRSLRLARELGDPIWSAHAINGLASTAVSTDDDGAPMLLGDAREQLRLIGDDNCLSANYRFQGMWHQEHGEPGAAARCYAEVVRLAETIDSVGHLTVALYQLASLSLEQGITDRLGRMVGALAHAVEEGVVALGGPTKQRILSLADDIGATPVDEPLAELVPLALELADEIAMES